MSSKKPGEGVGQFGTGFLSTFQLSMQAEVRSYLKEDGEPYRPFRICLDRSGTTQEAISAAIQQAMETLRAVDRDQRSREVARMGMEDLCRTLPCILLFSQRLGEVQLVAETEGRRKTVTFRWGSSRHGHSPGVCCWPQGRTGNYMNSAVPAGGSCRTMRGRTSGSMGGCGATRTGRFCTPSDLKLDKSGNEELKAISVCFNLF